MGGSAKRGGMGRMVRGTMWVISGLGVAALGLWCSLALWYRAPLGATLQGPLAAGFGLFSLAVLAVLIRARRPWTRPAVVGLYGLALVAFFAWWATLVPRDDRDWAPDLMRTVTGTVNGNLLTLHNVRNFDWTGDGTGEARWETRTYDLDQLVSVDLIADHWMGEAIAHVMISFGFKDGTFLLWSIELRRTRGQDFSAIAGFFRESELIYVAADERDALRLRARFRHEDLRIFRVDVPQKLARAFLLTYVAEANALAARPRWYNTLTTNCTTAMFKMTRLVEPGVPLDWRVLVSGYFPDYAYDHGVLDTGLPFPELRERSKVSPRALELDGVPQPQYSLKLREGLPGMDRPASP